MKKMRPPFRSFLFLGLSPSLSSCCSWTELCLLFLQPVRLKVSYLSFSYLLLLTGACLSVKSLKIWETYLMPFSYSKYPTPVSAGFLLLFSAFSYLFFNIFFWFIIVVCKRDVPLWALLTWLKEKTLW